MQGIQCPKPQEEGPAGAGPRQAWAGKREGSPFVPVHQFAPAALWKKNAMRVPTGPSKLFVERHTLQPRGASCSQGLGGPSQANEVCAMRVDQAWQAPTQPLQSRPSYLPHTSVSFLLYGCPMSPFLMGWPLELNGILGVKP